MTPRTDRVWVPKNPTATMLKQGEQRASELMGDPTGFAPDIWAAMIEAAPLDRMVHLTEDELRNLLKWSWIDGNSLPERLDGERQERMLSDIEGTFRDLDKYRSTPAPNYD